MGLHMTNVKIQKTIAILLSLMTMCTVLNLISKNSFTVSAGWSSVAELENYALANWTKPIQASYADINTGSRYFGANRTGTTRKHAANDYVCAVGTPVYAMTGGYVEEFSSNFYGGTQAISVKNDDESVARYCEIKTSFRSGDRVEKGQQIGTVIANNKGGGHMLHLEMYLGTASGSLTNTSNSTYWYVSYRNYCRRQDLIDPSFTQKIGNVTPPSISICEVNKNSFALGETAVFTASSDCATGYTIGIDKDGSRIITQDLNGNTFSFTPSEVGSYSAYVTAWNSAGIKDSSSVSFVVYGSSPSSPVLSILNGKKLFAKDETVEFSASADGSTGFTIGIDKNGSRIVTQDLNGNTFSFTPTEAGDYYSYVTAWNSIGLVDSPGITFKVYDSAPSESYLSISGESTTYEVNSTIGFVASSDIATGYTIGIDKDGSRVVTQDLNGNTYSYQPTEPGNYYAYVTSNKYGICDSKGITFKVYDSEPTYSKISLDKSDYNVNDDVQLNFESDNAIWYSVGIYKDGKRYDSIWDITENTYVYQVTEPGTYSAYVTSRNTLGWVDSQLVYFNVYSTIDGDCNNDGQFSVADVVMLQKWLLNDGTVLDNWKAADFHSDDMLNVLDLVLMKKKYNIL